MFDLSGRRALITGGGGVLGSAMARALAGAGAEVWLLGRRREVLEAAAAAIGPAARPCVGDVLCAESLEAVRAELEAAGGLDILINAAGGNRAGATVGPEASAFELSMPDFDAVLALNLQGTVRPCLALGPLLAASGRGVILNISSMAASRPLTRVVGYSAAKAAVESFTRWLAVELAQKHEAPPRVNALAPGFFLAEQNRALLTRPDGELTARGATIIGHTPLGRFGEPEDLAGATLWLCSDAARFVTGIVVPIDGGFSAFSGV